MTQLVAPPPPDVGLLASKYEKKSAEDVIRWTLETFGQRASVCSSFQAEGMVVLDMATRIDPSVRVFTLDTGRLPQETHDLIDRVRQRYGIQVDVYYPDHNELEGMVTEHGMNLFYGSASLRLLCCQVRKVEPLKRALSNFDAWITGIRRTQADTRSSSHKIETDPAHGGIIKVNPLADWSSEKLWDYIRSNDVPYNALYDAGYTSIGCAPCTRATKPGEDPRAGRWWWESGVPKECGIHMSPLLAGAVEKEQTTVSPNAGRNGSSNLGTL